MGHVLIVDNDLVSAETIGQLLRAEGYECSSAHTGHDAIRMASDAPPDVAVVDYDLPDLRGHEVVWAIRTQSPRTTCVMLTARWTLEVEFASTESGACACVSKPIVPIEVTEMIDRALQSRDERRIPVRRYGAPTQFEPSRPHATLRIVDKVVQFVGSAEDETTLEEFGRRVGISRGGFRNWCNTSALPAKSVLGFARGLRVVYRQQLDPAEQAAELLKIVDERTLAKFQVKSGGTSKGLPATVEMFLERQRFVERREFVGAVRDVLQSSGLIARIAMQDALPERRFAVR
jgi:DNA-binding response OmpR family regulator